MKEPKVSVLAKSVRKNKITPNFTKKQKIDSVLQKKGNGHRDKICKNKKIDGFISPAIKVANSAYDEKMPKATICDACHVDRYRWKSAAARARPIFLENCYEFIDFRRKMC